jgi:Ulp1 family protease
MSAQQLLLTKYNASLKTIPPYLKRRKIELHERTYLDNDNTYRLLHNDYVDDLLIDLFSIMITYEQQEDVQIISASMYYPTSPDNQTEDTLERYFNDNSNVILIPINFHGNHWILLRIFRNINIVEVYDSLNSSKKDIYSSEESLTYFLRDNFFDRQRFDFDVKDVIQQRNGIDCGLYVMFFMECILNNIEIPKKNSKLKLESKNSRMNVLTRLYKFVKNLIKNEHNNFDVNVIKKQKQNVYLTKARKTYTSCRR